MTLLQWCHLTPQGPNSDLAAVFFTKAVQVSSIRIFPSGSKPFGQCPELVAETEPDAFFLDVFFNALPVQPVNTGSQDSHDKPKNALVPTRIAYAGGQTEFGVDLGPEYATRLIIFQGQFKKVSMAIYGEVFGERPEISAYKPTPLPVSVPIPLSPALDVANSVHPTALAEQLLALMPSPAPLSLLIRLMFCLKPEKEDWDNPDFPYVFSHFDKIFGDDNIENEVFDLESLVQSVSKPMKDDVSAESLAEFVGKMRDLLGSNASDDAYYIAKLLTKSACQKTLFSKILLQHIDLVEIFNENSMDETTILCLAEAAASTEISRYFLEDPLFMQNLEDMIQSQKTHKSVQKALKKLINRIYGWRIFEYALENSDGDFSASSAFLKDITSDEFALGCWLECMINQEELNGKLARNAVVTNPRSAPPVLFQETPPSILHEEFVMFVRALLGVSTTLAMLAWSDSLGDDPCCERTLNLLVAWQGVDGYREILNHCLLLRQMARRLEWIKNDENDQRPKKAGILVERLLVGLSKDPRAILRNDVATTILALKPPFCYISADEMLEMEKLARVAQDGLLSAFEEIAFDSLRPFSLRRLRVLRLSLIIILEELAGDHGEWHVLEAFWNDRSQNLVSRLIAILSGISVDLNRHFSVEPITRMDHALSELLLRTSNDFLRLILRFANLYPFTTRDLKSLTAAVADLHACSNVAITTFSGSSSAHSTALNLVQVCLDVLTELSKPSVQADPDVPAAQVIFRTLLEHSPTKGGRDPVYHISQLYKLIDSILPRASDSADSTHWVTLIFPHVLHDIKGFSRLLSPETRLLFIERLVVADNGEIGLGEWLLEEELKDLSLLTTKLLNTRQNADYQLLLRAQLSAGLQLWEARLSSSISGWVITALSSNVDLCISFNNWLSLVLDSRISSKSLTRLVRALAKYHNDLHPDLKFTILLLLLRDAQQDSSGDNTLDFVPEILTSLPSSEINPEYLRMEIGHLLHFYSDHAPLMNLEAAERLLRVMEWLASQEDIKLTTLTGVPVQSFDYLCTILSSLLPQAQQDVLSSVRPKLSVDDDDLLPASSIELSESITLPLESITNLLSTQPKEPSTPKGTKTPDVLGVIISPPTAILRSPAATGLTKTYMNNDFRQLRQIPSTRLNASRLPSKHGASFIASFIPHDSQIFSRLFPRRFVVWILILFIVDEFQNLPGDLLPALDPMSYQGLPSSL